MQPTSTSKPEAESPPVRVLTSRLKKKPAISAKAMSTLERIRLSVMLVLLAGLSIYLWRSYQWSRQTKAIYTVLESEDANAALEMIVKLESDWGRSGESSFLRARSYRYLEDIELCERSINLASIDKYNSARLQHERQLLEVQCVAPLIDRQQFQNVLESYQASVDENATALGRGLKRTGQNELMLALTGIWQSELPQSSRLNYVNGLLAAEASLFDDADAEFKISYDKDPDFIPVWLELARGYLTNNNYPLAYKFFADFYEKRPNDAEAEGGYVETLLQLGEYQKVVDFFETRTIPMYVSGSGRIQLATALDGIEKPQAAIDLLLPVVEVWPEDGKATRLLSSAYRAIGDQDLANKYANQANDAILRQQKLAILRVNASEDPENAQLQYELGDLLLDVVSRFEALPFLQSALRLDPGMKAAHADLAKYYSSIGNIELAQYHQDFLDSDQ